MTTPKAFNIHTMFAIHPHIGDLKVRKISAFGDSGYSSEEMKKSPFGEETAVSKIVEMKRMSEMSYHRE